MKLVWRRDRKAWEIFMKVIMNFRYKQEKVVKYCYGNVRFRWGDSSDQNIYFEMKKKLKVRTWAAILKSARRVGYQKRRHEECAFAEVSVYRSLHY